MAAENVLFLLADQWPAWAFGFRGADIPTPNLDCLAAESTVFDNAFTSCPLCTPARAALLTGRWPHQTGVYDNHNVGHSQQASLSMNENTWLDQAVRSGRHVGYFGKWHLGINDAEARGAHGFDPQAETRRLPPPEQREPYSYELMKRRYEEQGRQLVRGRAPFWGETDTPKEDKIPFPFVARGIDFLRDWAAHGREQPLFLTVSSASPHFPHHLPAEYARLADKLRETVTLPASLDDNCAGRPWFHSTPWWPCMDTSVLDRDEWRTVVAYSRAHIALVDEAFGRMLDALDELGLTDSTTVVLTADHGDMEGAHNRFDKGPYFYDEVWRIPLMVRRPNTPPATQPTFVSILDVGEAMFALAGAEGTEQHNRAGRNLLELVGTPSPRRDWPDVAYGVYDLYNGISFVVRAIRTDRWKYVWNPQGIHELYDLAADPHEMRSLAGEAAYAEVEADLRTRLLAWLDEIGDDLPDRVGDLPAAGTVIATDQPGP